MPPLRSREGAFALKLFFLVCLSWGVLAVLLGQDSNFDFWSYHWYSGYALLTGRYAFDFMPSHTASFYNPLIHAPYYFVAAHVSPLLAGFALAAIQGMNFALLFMITYACLNIQDEMRKTLVCATLALVGMTGAASLGEIGVTAYDNVVSLGALFALVLLLQRLRFFSEAASAARVAVCALACGLPLGLAFGLKLTVVTFCVGATLCLLFLSAPWRRRLLVSFAFGVGVALGFLATYGWWGWHLQSQFQSPFFPYFNTIFQSPLAVAHFTRDTSFVPRSLGEFLFFPFVLALDPLRGNETPWRDWRMPALFVAVLVACATRCAKGAARGEGAGIVNAQPARLVFAFSFFSYVVWLALFGNYRYATPLEMLAPSLMALAIMAMPVAARTRGALLVAALILVTLSVQSQIALREPWDARDADRAARHFRSGADDDPDVRSHARCAGDKRVSADHPLCPHRRLLFNAGRRAGYQRTHPQTPQRPYWPFPAAAPSRRPPKRGTIPAIFRPHL